MNKSMVVLSPVSTGVRASQQSQRTLTEVAGKVIGFIDNSKPNFSHLVDDLAEILVTRHGAAAVLKRRKGSPSLPAPIAIANELYDRCDAVITGSGD